VLPGGDPVGAKEARAVEHVGGGAGEGFALECGVARERFGFEAVPVRVSFRPKRKREDMAG
jgi:hypothetical protein